ncbi:MAG: hypothetical protein AVDCRST_MAG05-1934, partial [uncultured Rubrobacteraceae bacterium]
EHQRAGAAAERGPEEDRRPDAPVGPEDPRRHGGAEPAGGSEGQGDRAQDREGRRGPQAPARYQGGLPGVDGVHAVYGVFAAYGVHAVRGAGAGGERGRRGQGDGQGHAPRRVPAVQRRRGGGGPGPARHRGHRRPRRPARPQRAEGRRDLTPDDRGHRRRSGHDPSRRGQSGPDGPGDVRV